MNNEIEVGEWIRTEDGQISKNNSNYNWDLKETYINDSPVVKHSKIKSEIVEVGDYVNGKLIHKIDKGPNYCYLYYGNCKTFVDYQIKTIVTKEAFKEREYVF